MKELPKSAKTDELLNVQIKLRDQFENVISSNKFSDKITAEAISGNLNFKSTSLSVSGYSVGLVPLYPPRFLSFKLYMAIGKNQKVQIYPKALSILVDTTLDPSKTQASPVSESVEDPFKFTVKLNDVKGYCFETQGAVYVTIKGPFASGTEGKNKI